MILFRSSLLQPNFKIQQNITFSLDLIHRVSFFLMSICCLKHIYLNNIQSVIYIELILLFDEITCCKKRAVKDITKAKLETLLENFMIIFGVISYFILGKTEDSGNFTISHSIENSLRQKRVFWMF